MERRVMPEGFWFAERVTEMLVLAKTEKLTMPGERARVNVEMEE
jgi:hypothetical protein